MPEIDQAAPQPDQSGAAYLQLFNEGQRERAAKFFGGCRTALGALAQKLTELGVEPTLMSDFAMQQSHLIQADGGRAFCDQVQHLIASSEASAVICTPHMLQCLTRNCTITKLEQLAAARAIVECGVYTAHT